LNYSNFVAVSFSFTHLFRFQLGLQELFCLNTTKVWPWLRLASSKSVITDLSAPKARPATSLPLESQP
jgi:hypothetical protein